MPSRTHVFAVAVETYHDPAIPAVAFAEGDAGRFVAAWRGLGVEAGHVFLLTGSGATYMTVLSRLKACLSRVGEGDRVVFYYAGHGADLAGNGHLAVYDTQSADGEGTSLPLRQILRLLGQAKGGSVLLFLDAGHGGWAADGQAEFSAQEVDEFCRDSAGRAAFIACGAGQRSHASPTLQAGLWNHCLVRALRGEAKGALAQGSLVTGRSLRDYLADAVPRLLRETQAGAAAQAPVAFGSLTPEWGVADLRGVTPQAAPPDAAGFPLREAYLTGQKTGPLRALGGYRKGQFVPEGRAGRADAFVKGIGKAEVREQAVALRDALKAAFGYKLKDLQFADGDGEVTLKTPAFDVDVAIEIDADDAAFYALTTKVSAFRDPAAAEDERFGDLFSPYCDTVVLASARPLEIPALISQIEEQEALAAHLDYPPEGDSFTLAFPQERLRLRANARGITIRREGPGGLRAQLASIQKLLASLGGAGIALLPSGPQA